MVLRRRKDGVSVAKVRLMRDHNATIVHHPAWSASVQVITIVLHVI